MTEKEGPTVKLTRDSFVQQEETKSTGHKIHFTLSVHNNI